MVVDVEDCPTDGHFLIESGDLYCNTESGCLDPTDGLDSGLARIVRFGDALDGRFEARGRWALGELYGEIEKYGKEWEGDSFPVPFWR